jgi:hypothetical protein
MLAKLELTSALLLMVDLLFARVPELFVRLIFELVCPAWLRFILEFCFMDDGLSNLDL